MADRSAEPGLARNTRLGVANGILFSFGEALNNGNLVLGPLVRQLGGGLWIVGLLPALQSGGWLLPQMLVGGRLQAQPYKLPLYRRSATVRILAYGALVAVIMLADVVRPELALAAIIVCYTVFNVGGGTSALAFQDVVAKVIPPRRRGNFFGVRQLYGGLLAFALAGPLVALLLNSNGPLPFPLNFGLLALLSLVFMSVGLLSFCFVIEPPQRNVGRRQSFLETLRSAPDLLRRDHTYRTFVLSRLLTRVGQIGEPFYIIYAREVLGLPATIIGVYLAVRALSAALSNIYWGRVSDRQGNRRLMLLTGALIVCAPIVVLVGPWLAQLLGLGVAGLAVAMGLVYLLAGLAMDGSNIAGLTYLMEVAPEHERPTYTGIANTLLGVITLLPVLGGWLVQHVGYGGLFSLALVFAVAGLFTVGRLPERIAAESTPQRADLRPQPSAERP
ncbi:MAG: MFS transporter [Chloroflexales bacterium]|nr:MFS transporter [Chloroflexales bacterium]